MTGVQTCALPILDPDYIMHEEFPNVQKAVIDFVGASGANITLNGHFPLPDGSEELFILEISLRIKIKTSKRKKKQVEWNSL